MPCDVVEAGEALLDAAQLLQHNTQASDRLKILAQRTRDAGDTSLGRRGLVKLPRNQAVASQQQGSEFYTFSLPPACSKSSPSLADWILQGRIGVAWLYRPVCCPRDGCGSKIFEGKEWAHRPLLDVAAQNTLIFRRFVCKGEEPQGIRKAGKIPFLQISIIHEPLVC